MVFPCIRILLTSSSFIRQWIKSLQLNVIVFSALCGLNYCMCLCGVPGLFRLNIFIWWWKWALQKSFLCQIKFITFQLIKFNELVILGKVYRPCTSWSVDMVCRPCLQTCRHVSCRHACHVDTLYMVCRAFQSFCANHWHCHRFQHLHIYRKYRTNCKNRFDVNADQLCIPWYLITI